jgi:hypothetical protein
MMAEISPRIILIPMTGGDQKAQAKGIRYAHGLHLQGLIKRLGFQTMHE